MNRFSGCCSIAILALTYGCGGESVAPVADAATDGMVATRDSGIDGQVVDAPNVLWTICSEAARFGREGDTCAGDFPCSRCITDNGVSTTLEVACVAGTIRLNRGADCRPADDAGALDQGAGDGVLDAGFANDTRTLVDAVVVDSMGTDTNTPPDVATETGAIDGGLCAPYQVPAPTASACYVGTRYCLTASTTDDQFTQCLNADTVPNSACATCLFDDYSACATLPVNCCADERGLVRCCERAACPSGAEACIVATRLTGGACEVEWTRFANCRTATPCQLRPDPCLPPYRACDPIVLPPPATRACAASTRTCLQNGGTRQNCSVTDPNSTACNQCLDTDTLFCMTRHGCADEFGQRECCLTTACPSGAVSCRAAAIEVGGACRNQQNAWGACFDAVTPTCQNELLSNCFPN